MTNILHVSCSPRGQASESDRLAQKIIGLLREHAPGASLTTRAIGAGALGHIDSNYALALGNAQLQVPLQGSMAQSEELICELERADVVVIGTPMHNLTVPSTLKAWIDHIARIGRTFEVSARGKVGMLGDRPVFVAISSGGRFSGERARQPDFLTPYLKVILATLGLHDVRFFSVEGTAGGPDAAAEARSAADQALREHFAGPVLA